MTNQFHKATVKIPTELTFILKFLNFVFKFILNKIFKQFNFIPYINKYYFIII